MCVKSLQSCLTLCDPMDHISSGSSVHGIFPGMNTGMGFSRHEYWVGYHVLLLGIFLTQGSNPHFLHLLHWQAAFLPLAPSGKPNEPLGAMNEVAKTWWNITKTIGNHELFCDSSFPGIFLWFLCCLNLLS